MTRFNGWTNYETWLTNLHFECFDFSDLISDIASDCKDRVDVIEWIANYIESAVEEWVEERSVADSFLSDVIKSFVDDVDWHDIADNYADDVMTSIEDREIAHQEQMRLAHCF